MCHHFKTSGQLESKSLFQVNEKNALVRRQMQLNIREKEASISTRHEGIMEELQKVGK
jgi:hypothetical protein